MKAVVSTNGLKYILLTVLIVLPAIIIYMPIINHDPILDDPKQIEYVKQFDSVWSCFTSDSASWFRPHKNFVFYLTYSEQYGVAWTKTVCLILFLSSIFVMYALLRRIFNTVGWALLGAGLFAFNPTMVSTVQFLSASNNQFALIFILMALCCGLDYAKRTSDPTVKAWPIVLFAATLSLQMMAMASYEVAIVVPGMLIVLLVAKHDWRYCLSRHGVRLWVGSLLMVAGYLIVRSGAASMDFTSPSLPPNVDRVDLILRAPYYTWRHFLLWIDPWGRGGVFIDDDPRNQLTSGLLGWGMLVSLSLVLLRLLASSWRVIAAGLLIFLGGMIPLANFLGLENGPICNYYLLIPGLGLVIAGTDLCRRIWAFSPAWAKGLAGALMIVYLGFCITETILRIDAWRSEDSLIDFSVENYPHNYHGLNLQGLRLIRQGEFSRGQEVLAESRQIAPWEIKAYVYSANGYRRQGRISEAKRVLTDHILVNNYLDWTIGMHLAEVNVQLGDWNEVGRIIELLSATHPNPEFESRYYTYVVIPYFIQMSMQERARLLTKEVMQNFRGSSTTWRQLQEIHQFLTTESNNPPARRDSVDGLP